MPNIILLVEICLIYPIIYTANTIFQTIALSFFSIYGKISSCKKNKKIHRVDPEDNASQMERQTDRWANEKN